VAVPGDLARSALGLDIDTWRTLAQEVDTIFHCGTSMNHLETYQMARPANVQGVRELLRLAVEKRTKRFNYISTLAVFGMSSGAGRRNIDETSSIDAEMHRDASGYAASKWVGEKLVLLAMERGLPCNVFRLGLIWADTDRGRYDELQREYRVF